MSVQPGGAPGRAGGVVARCASALEEMKTHDVVLFYMMMTKYISGRQMTPSLLSLLSPSRFSSLGCFAEEIEKPELTQLFAFWALFLFV